jgi:hypothetical protein
MAFASPSRRTGRAHRSSGRRPGSLTWSSTYRLTDAGLELGMVVGALNDWGVRWRIPDGGPPNLDPDGLMLWVRRHVALDQLPPGRVVVGFRLLADAKAKGRRSYWLVLQPGKVSLCPEHPGFESTSGSPPSRPRSTSSSLAASACPRPSTTTACASTDHSAWSGPSPAGSGCAPEHLPSIPASSLHFGHTGNRCGSRIGANLCPHRWTLLAICAAPTRRRGGSARPVRG